MVMTGTTETAYAALVKSDYSSDARAPNRARISELIEEGNPIYVIAQNDVEIPEYLASHAKKIFLYEMGTPFSNHLASIMEEAGSRAVMVI